MALARSAILARPLRDVTVAELSALFLSSAKPPHEWMIGLELELFPHDRATRRPADHATLARVLARLGARRGMAEQREGDALIGLAGAGQLISLEPGGQLEVATKPHVRLRAMRNEVVEYARDLAEAGAEEGVGFWALGHHPFETRDTVPKMPKARYDRMRSYMAGAGARALDMMHLTASVQCAVDFSGPENLARKVRAAALASPFVSALVAASPFSRGKPNGFQSMRYQIWLETDEPRSGLWPEMVDAEGFGIPRYVQRALATPPMFVIRDGEYLDAGDRPYAELAERGFRGTTITVSDFLDHLTTFFPEIRPKTYVELRGADCRPPREAVAIAGLWRGLLDDDASLDAVIDRLGPHLSGPDLRVLQRGVARFGLAASSPAGPVREIARWLTHLAYDRLSRTSCDCAECLLVLVERSDRGRSPADDMLELAAKSSIEAALDRYASITGDQTAC
jgi:glutamate--cysteine ligase